MNYKDLTALSIKILPNDKSNTLPSYLTKILMITNLVLSTATNIINSLNNLKPDCYLLIKDIAFV